MLVSYKLLRQSGVVLRGLKGLEKKNLGKCTLYIGIEVISTFFCLAFSLLPVLIQRY